MQLEKEGIMIVGVIVCAVVLLFVALRKKSELLMNFVLRGILGTLGIYYVNNFLLSLLAILISPLFIYYINNFLALQGIYCEVGINPCTVLASAGLGFPGLILLYGISFYNFL